MGFEFDSRRFRQSVGQQLARADVPGKCPNCGAAFKARVQDFVSGRTIACSMCKCQIKLEDKNGGMGRIVRGQY